MKTARELFEELGYTYRIDKLDELVKKSVPKKVIEIETIYKCPICDTYLLFKHENMCLRLENTQTYCSSCGQRLDWGEE